MITSDITILCILASTLIVTTQASLLSTHRKVVIHVPYKIHTIHKKTVKYVFVKDKGKEGEQEQLGFGESDEDSSDPFGDYGPSSSSVSEHGQGTGVTGNSGINEGHGASSQNVKHIGGQAEEQKGGFSGEYYGESPSYSESSAPKFEYSDSGNGPEKSKEEDHGNFEIVGGFPSGGDGRNNLFNHEFNNHDPGFGVSTQNTQSESYHQQNTGTNVGQIGYGRYNGQTDQGFAHNSKNIRQHLGYNRGYSGHGHTQNGNKIANGHSNSNTNTQSVNLQDSRQKNVFSGHGGQFEGKDQKQYQVYESNEEEKFRNSGDFSFGETQTYSQKRRPQDQGQMFHLKKPLRGFALGSPKGFSKMSPEENNQHNSGSSSEEFKKEPIKDFVETFIKDHRGYDYSPSPATNIELESFGHNHGSSGEHINYGSRKPGRGSSGNVENVDFVPDSYLSQTQGVANVHNLNVIQGNNGQEPGALEDNVKLYGDGHLMYAYQVGDHTFVQVHRF